jgi:spermidine synthase
MGIHSILIQVICLRKLLALFSGNELDIGITLSVWLTAVGIGSAVGWRFKAKHAFGLSFLALSLMIQPTLLFMDSIMVIFSIEMGEVISLTVTIIATVITLLPLCIIIGIQFPMAVSYLNGMTARVYSFEAAGAFVGGVLFTLVFSGRMDVNQLALLISAVDILMALYLLKKRVVLIFIVIPVGLYLVSTFASPHLRYRELSLADRIESRYGEISVIQTEKQKSIYVSGKLHLSYPDPQTEEVKAHIPMSLHPSSDKILLVGGSPAVIREYLRYPITSIDFIEIDPVLIGISTSLLSADDRAYVEDERVTLLSRDARRIIKSLDSPLYDLIVLNIPEPSTANLNRFYTLEFFEEASAALKDDGILYLSLPVAFGYIGRRMQMANGSIFQSLKEIFPFVEVSSEEYGIIASSRSPINIDPKVIAERFIEKEFATKYLNPSLLRDAFDPLKVSMVKGRLGKVREINRDFRPVSYLYNLMLWSEVHGGRWLNVLLGLNEIEMTVLILIVLLILTAFFVKKGRAISFVILTTGYFTMAFSLIVILAYQSSFGYIYEMIGLLTGTFMLGGAAGAYMMKAVDRPLKWLMVFDMVTLLLLGSSTVIMKGELIFYVLIFASGVIGGAQFAAASLSLKGEERGRSAGRLYAIDLVGSFLGSFLAAIFMVPLLGIQRTIVFLIFVKAVSIIVIFRQGKYMAFRG